MSIEPRPHVRIRGVYGGVPTQILNRGATLAHYGINAVWLGSGSVNTERVQLLRGQGAAVFAEFNTLHEAGYLNEHPDAAPVGIDDRVCPPPDGWQGICPTHPGYRAYRMEAFRSLLEQHAIDGVWLDYHHSHASWEQAIPNMPDTCFCSRCIGLFQDQTGTAVRTAGARDILWEHEDAWVRWRCGVFTDWVREFRRILDETRPGTLLGTFHCPWSDKEFDGALRRKLAIDLSAQAEFVDVFSIMPYHARFAHPQDPAWIPRQTAWLGGHLGIEGREREGPRIWPIVQLSDWGESVPVQQIEQVLDHGSRPPATGVTVFAWGGLQDDQAKVEELGRCYRSITGEAKQ